LAWASELPSVRRQNINCLKRLPIRPEAIVKDDYHSTLITWHEAGRAPTAANRQGHDAHSFV